MLRERSVRKALVELSMCGRLEGIVVEDAHVVVEWGDVFRWRTADAHFWRLSSM
jgi:superfamily II DNA helicase RecQ